MNESERKFFLKNFFSFNVSSSVNSGSSNVSFNEISEVEEDSGSGSSYGDNKTTSNTKDETLKQIETNTATAETLAGKQMNDKSSEKSSSSSDNAKSPNSAPKSSLKKYNKKSLLLQQQHNNNNHNHEETVEFTDLSANHIQFVNAGASAKTSPPLIQISNCKEDTNTAETRLLYSTTTGGTNPHVNLQQQHSIELKPFKKKEVHISDSLEIDYLTSNNKLSTNYDSLSNSFNNSIKSDYSHNLNTTTTTMTTLSSIDDITLVKSEADSTANLIVEAPFANNNANSNTNGQNGRASIGDLLSPHACTLVLPDKLGDEPHIVPTKQLTSYLNSPGASMRLSLTPKFISIRYRLVELISSLSLFFFFSFFDL